MTRTLLALATTAVLTACGTAAAPAPPRNSFPVKEIKLEGGTHAQFVQDAVLGAFLKNGAVMSPTGASLKGNYEALYLPGTTEPVSTDNIVALRINLSGINPNGTSVAAVAEVNRQDAAIALPGKTMFDDINLGDLAQTAGSKVAEQFRLQLMSQQQYQRK